MWLRDVDVYVTMSGHLSVDPGPSYLLLLHYVVATRSNSSERRTIEIPSRHWARYQGIATASLQWNVISQGPMIRNPHMSI